jgi:hypothetical protein
VGAEGGPACNSSKQPVLLIHGWGGQDLLEDDTMGFAQLSRWMQAEGYVLGCNMFYATEVKAENSRDKNSEKIQSNLHTAYNLIVGYNPSWRGHFDIIGHSYGGLNARFYLESSRYTDDNRYGQYGIHVDNLFTLGSPHGGVLIPQEFYPLSLVIAFPKIVDPQKWPSTLQLTSGQMDAYNNSHEQPDGTCYRLVGGDFLQQANASWFWQKLYSPFPHGDIGVSLRSSRQLGINSSLQNRYPRVGYVTNSDMHGYVPEDVTPIGGLALTGLRSYVSPTLTYNESIAPYLGAGMSQCHTTQANLLSMAGTLTEELAMPPILIASGSITGGQNMTGTLPVDWSGQTAFYVSWMGGDVDLILRDPTGVVFTPTVALSDTNADYGKVLFGASGLATYIFTNTLTGEWAYTLTAASGPYPIAFDLYVNPDSPLVARAFAPVWQPFGAPALITASLFYSATPVSTATMQAHIARPNGMESSLVLHDDGVSPDATAGDGIYSKAYTDTTTSGFYSVWVEADGVYNSHTYHRAAQTVFPVASNSAALRDAYADQPQDSNGNGLYEELDVTVGISATQPGDFSVSAVLQGAGGQYIDLANATLYSSTGMLTATLHFAGQAIYNSGLDGPYTVTQVMLLDDADLIKLDEATNAWTTAAYDHLQFRQQYLVFLPVVLR